MEKRSENMEKLPKILYSYTEGPIIAAKLRDTNGENFIRMGISFPINDSNRYHTIFKPEGDYCSAEILSYLLDLEKLIGKKFTLRKAELCYGGSVKMIDVDRRIGHESISVSYTHLTLPTKA